MAFGITTKHAMDNTKGVVVTYTMASTSTAHDMVKVRYKDGATKTVSLNEFNCRYSKLTSMW